MVVSVKGVIDNGGFHYFMERDLPEKTRHAETAESFRIIGQGEVALMIETACELVGDVRGLNYEQRKERLERYSEIIQKLDSDFYRWSDRIDAALELMVRNFCSVMATTMPNLRCNGRLVDRFRAL
ncbi:MAG: DUF4375 domain-containing protein [Gammaproteobacteria bacterium]|nr:DUF4375 domain-containing protein [Gammaproteobacteria bacterium]